jgi:hypothetical protein
MDLINLLNIKNGIINSMKNGVGILSEDIIKLSDARMDICNKCPNKSELNTCKLCGCFLPFKTKSVNSSCDENKW